MKMCMVCGRIASEPQQLLPGTKAVIFTVAVEDAAGVQQTADITLGPYCQDHADKLNNLLVKYGISMPILGVLTTRLRALGFLLIPQSQVAYAFIDFVDDEESRRASKAAWN